MTSHLDVGATLGRVFEMYRKHLTTLLLVAVIVWVPVGIVFGLIADSGNIGLRMIANLLQFVATFLLAGLVIKLVEADRASEPEPKISELFDRVGPRLLPLIGIAILAAIGIGIAAIFLVIPALILATYWIALAPAIVVESDRSAFDAFGRSMKLVSGNFWRVVLVLIVIILIVIAVFIVALAFVAITPILGIIVLIALAVLLAPLSALVQAQVYFDLREAHGEAAGAVAAPAGQWAPPAAPGGPPPPPPPAPAQPAAPAPPAAPAQAPPPPAAQPPAPPAAAPAAAPPAAPAAPDAPTTPGVTPPQQPPAPGGGVTSGDPLAEPDRPASQPPPSQPPPGAA